MTIVPLIVYAAQFLQNIVFKRSAQKKLQAVGDSASLGACRNWA